MFSFIKRLLLIAALCVPWVTQAQGTAITSFPFTCDFEDASDNAYWSFQNASNGWYIGTAVNHGGTHALYVGEGSASSNSYNASASGVSYAYLTFDIANAGQYAIQFDWKCNGESTYDFLRVAVAPSTQSLTTTYGDWTATSVPSGFMAIDGGNKLNLQTSWQTHTAVATVPAAGTYRLLFVWRNDGSVANQPPAAIDNIVVTEISCPQPTALAAIPTTNQLDITWTAGGNETEWMVSINDGDEDFVSTTSYTFSNLTANTAYQVKVYAICGAGDTSLATVGNFRTSCPLIEGSMLPFTENFETYGSGSTAFPTCWYKIGSTADRPYIHATTSYGHNNTHGLYFFAAASGYCYGVMPPVDPTVDLTTLQVSFWARQYSTSYNCDFVVGVMTNPTDATTFTPVGQVHPNGTTYEFFEVPLTTYTGTGNFIAFQAVQHPGSSTDIYMMLDDVTIDYTPACPTPLSLNADSVASDAVNLYWEDPINSEWLLIYGPSGFNPDTAVTNVLTLTDTTTLISDLTANTLYDFYLAALCIDGDTTMFRMISVRTACEAISTLPYSENFDTYGAGTTIIPSCWYKLGSTADRPYINSSTTYGHNGTYGLYFYAAAGGYCYGVMPPVDPTLDLTTLQVSFWARQYSTSYNCDFVVGVMTNPTDASTFTPVGQVHPAGTTYEFFEVPLTTYTGTGNYIAFKAVQHPGTSTAIYLMLDDVILETQPTCPGIANINANATANSALITWELRGSVTNEPSSFNIVVRDEQNSTNTYTTSDMYYMLTGLNAGTTYSVSITPDCGNDGYGSSDSISFSTQALPCIQLDPTTTGTIVFSNASGTTPGTTYYLPLNNYYNYTYTQQLFLASELGGANQFTGIDFQYGYSSPSTAKASGVSIYLANVTQSSLSSGFVPYNASTFQLVYTGALNCTQGWNHFNFTTPFNYDGTSNLLVVVLDGSGDYDGNSYVFNTHPAPGMGRHEYNDDDPYALSSVSGGDVVDYRVNMKLTGYGCAQTGGCVAPYATIDSLSDSEVSISWIPGTNETSWDLDYRVDGNTVWTNAASGFTSTNYTFTGLNAATSYEFRVSYVCSDNNETYGTILSANTLCNEVALPYLQGFETVSTNTSTSGNYGVMPNCWDYVLTGSGSYITGSYLPGVYFSSTYANTGNYSLRLAGKGYFMLPPVATTLDSVMLTMNCYKTSSSYDIEVGVMEANGTFVPIAQPTTTSSQHTPIEVSFASYTGTSRVIALHNTYSSYDYSYIYVDDIVVDYLPDCPRVEGVSANHIGQDGATIHWASGNSGDYEVVYGLTGFNPADSIPVVVNAADSLDLTNLSGNTAYDVYVREICTGGGYGAWSFTYTFRTECGPITVLPYFEGFETYPVGSSTATMYEIPCWGRLDNAGQNHFGYVNNASSWAAGPHTGDKFIYYYLPSTTGTHCDWNITILPPIDTLIYPMNTLQMSFWVRMNSASTSSFIEVGVISDATDETTFTPVDTVPVSGDVHTLKTAYLSSFTGYGDRIAMRFHRTTESTAHYFFIDDITIEPIPDCPPVSSVTLISSDENSITLSWSENGNAASWNVEYGPSGFTLGTGTTTVASTVPFTITGLSANTGYDVYITPECTSGVAATTMGSFRTACGPITVLPYFENFDSYTGSTATSPVPAGFQPPCWDFYNDGTRSNYMYSPYVYNSSTYARSGSNCIRFYSYNSSGDSNQYLILPIIDSTAYEVSDLQVSFWVRGYSTSSNYRADVVVGVMTNILDESSFIPYDTILCASTTYSYHEVIFSQYTGYNGRITLLFPKPLTSSSYEYGYIDDVTVEPIPACPPVSNIVLAGLDSNMLSVTWTENGNAASWDVEYGLHGFTQGTGTTATVTTLPFTVNGLTPNTEYDFYITPDCTSGTAATRMGTFRTANTYVALPLSCNFENATQNNLWLLENGSLTNKWHIGSATNNGGTNALYISNDNGTSNSYTISSSTIVYAYTDVMINTPGEIGFSFDWKCQGESTLDYIRAALVPVSETFTAGTSLPSGLSATSMPSNWISLDNNNKLNLTGTWQTQSGTVNITSAGVYHLVFVFRCDGSVGTQPPAAIDNVELAQMTCPQAQNIHVTATTTNSITIDWTDPITVSEWQVEYSGNGTTNVIGVMAHPATLPNLLTATAYSIRVRPICGNGDTAFWSSAINVATECGLVSLPYTEGFEAYTGTTYSTAGVMPACWDGYSNGTTAAYMPHITGSGSYWYPHSGSNALTMTSGSAAYGDTKIAVLPPFDQPVSSLTMTYWYKMENATNGSTLYVGYVTGPDFANSFVPLKTVTSTTTLTRDSITFDTVPATATRIAFKWYHNSSFYSVGIDDIEVTSNGPVCNKPTLLPVTDLDYQAATINWNSTATEFEVTYKAVTEGTWPNAVSVSTTSYDITGLNPATDYQYRIRAICDATENLISDWVMGTFNTDSLPCFAPTNLHTTNVGYTSVNLAWSASSEQNHWTLTVWNTADTVDYDVTGNAAYTVSGLSQGNQYYAAVKAVCGNGAAESEYSDTIQFATNNCEQVAGVTVNNITENSAVVSWQAATATSYEVDYGPVGHGQGQGTTVTVNNATTYTITGLESETGYSVYVRALCEADAPGPWSQVQEFTTLEGGIGIDVADGMNVSIYPNPTSSTTTIALSGVNGDVAITVVDMNGRVVMSDSMSCEGDCVKTMEVSGLAQGAYFVRINGENVNMVKKLVVK